MRRSARSRRTTLHPRRSWLATAEAGPQACPERRPPGPDHRRRGFRIYSGWHPCAKPGAAIRSGVAMARLNPLDLAMLAMDRSARPMHSGVTMIFEPTAGEDAATMVQRTLAAFRE